MISQFERINRNVDEMKNEDITGFQHKKQRQTYNTRGNLKQPVNLKKEKKLMKKCGLLMILDVKRGVSL